MGGHPEWRQRKTRRWQKNPAPATGMRHHQARPQFGPRAGMRATAIHCSCPPETRARRTPLAAPRRSGQNCGSMGRRDRDGRGDRVGGARTELGARAQSCRDAMKLADGFNGMRISAPLFLFSSAGRFQAFFNASGSVGCLLSKSGIFGVPVHCKTGGALVRPRLPVKIQPCSGQISRRGESLCALMPQTPDPIGTGEVDSK